MFQGWAPMRAMIEIEWIDGHVTRIPELALGDAFGESVQAEVDIRFDDLSDGLVVEVRYHEPDGETGGDPRGRACAVYADCFYSLIEPEDLGRVQCLLYEGTVRTDPRSNFLSAPSVGEIALAESAKVRWRNWLFLQ